MVNEDVEAQGVVAEDRAAVNGAVVVATVGIVAVDEEEVCSE